ncbi:MAG: hypothetical protein MUE50_04455 [Pirellulaceae bacterium]|jgi:hypothetical protein|nr:hypothetical protein [Pirellulaceae bacterium]
MYNTPDGIRVLQGAERRLFVESLGMLVDMLRLDELPTDIQVLDDLTQNQRIATYHAAARALLAEDEPPPALTAVIEGAVASVYRHVRDMISMELDVAEVDDVVDFDFGELPEAPSWRERAVVAAREVGIEDLPNPDDQDWDDWDLLIECLEGRLLWDDDWDMVDHLDATPEVARRAKAKLGISDDYFVAIPDDPSDAEAERLLAELIALTRDAR